MASRTDPTFVDPFAGLAMQVLEGEPLSEDPPWIVAFVRPGEAPFCGGCVVSTSPGTGDGFWVLTAAHCGIEAGHTAVVGKRRVPANSQGQMVRRVCRHPSFDADDLSFDLALVLVEGTASEAIDLAAIDTPLSAGVVMGWGLTETNQPPEELLAATVQVLEEGNVWPAACIGLKGERSSPVLCAGNQQGGPCFGDSGGPLLVEQNGVTVLAGVYSDGCGEAVFEDMRLAAHQAWLHEVVEGPDTESIGALCS